MKTKIAVVIIAAITIISFDSCVFRAGGHFRGGGHEHERGHSYVQPTTDSLRNVALNAPNIQPSTPVLD
jgi:hypothetical protein